MYHRRKSHSTARQFVHDDSVCDPILNGNTIQDIIEMTTSGSGSGELPDFCDFQLNIVLILYFI